MKNFAGFRRKIMLIMLTKADILNAEPVCSALTTHHTSAHWWCLMDDVNVHPIDRMLKPTHILSYTVHLQGFAVLWWGQKQIPDPRLHSSSTIYNPSFNLCSWGIRGGILHYIGGWDCCKNMPDIALLFAPPNSWRPLTGHTISDRACVMRNKTTSLGVAATNDLTTIQWLQSGSNI